MPSLVPRGSISTEQALFNVSKEDKVLEVKDVKDQVVECDIFSHNTFLPFYEEQLFTDLVLVGPDGKEHAVHSVVVANRSNWIHRKLLEQTQQTPSERPWRLQISFPDPARVFSHFVRALYTGQIEMTSESATGKEYWFCLLLFFFVHTSYFSFLFFEAINNLARHLEVPSLMKEVAQYLTSTVQRHNCVSMLRQVVHLLPSLFGPSPKFRFGFFLTKCDSL